MTPYRDQREATPAAPPTAGLVADMVRQFSDPYAFLRELVQNGIDAGATALDVRIEHLPDGTCATSVSDDGSGMALETLEGPLLTLFSSSKENDATKIGKYGVGFVSVLAIEPDEVVVETWQRGKAFVMRLLPDHRYEIEAATPRPGGGTTVTLRKRLDAAAFAGHVAQARDSLRRWCRHAERPIRLRVAGAGEGDPEIEVRIDTPLAVWSPISVRVDAPDGDVYVVGPSPGSEILPDAPFEGPVSPECAPHFAGFYNRGLTLFETSDEWFPGLANVRFKVQSARLQHTLSRDDVRRDGAFARAIVRVCEAVAGPLRRAAVDGLREAAAAASFGERTAEYAAIGTAALAPPLSLSPEEMSFPLTDPVAGARVLADLGRRTPGRAPLFASEPCAVTAALAAEGIPVVRASHPEIAAVLRRCFSGKTIEAARDAYLLAHTAPATPEDEVLLDELARAAEAADAPITGARLGALEGAEQHRAAVLVRELPRLVSVRDLKGSWGRWARRALLVLNTGSEIVRAARRLAAADPRAAAHLLLRAILVEARGPIGDQVNARLLELAGGGR
jgi:Histidine kinase-, DNA gyrase B-, and HSP90-like ATPase